VPVVFDAHTTLESELPSYSRHGRAFLRRFGRAMDARLPARADHVIAVSEQIQAKLNHSHGVPADRVSVIPNGVEECFFATESEGAAPRAAAGPNLVFAGNLASYQGIDVLLASFAKALQQRSDVRLTLISDDRLDAYEQLATRLGVREHIDLISAGIEDLPHHLAEAGVLLNPRAEGDGSPMKILNYMAAGRPIVSFAGTARHLVDGQDALIVPNGDTDAFADAILRLCSDHALARRLGEGAQRSARSEFSWTRTAERVERVYAKLAPVITSAR
jgi:glycosyltransferase involved in cell wall biosynthesis